MKKKIWALISAMIVVSIVFASCTAGAGNSGDVEAANTSDPAIEEVVGNDPQADQVIDTADQEGSTEDESDDFAKKETGSAVAANLETITPTTQKQTTTQKQSTTQKPSTTTTTKKESTTKKETTTQKQTTTKQETTTKKETTTQKNVTAKEVQDQVNAYIKSKGFIFDPSLTPSTAGWYGQISRIQDALNDGSTLRNCKGYVDILLTETDPSRTAAYCYYDSEAFYVLYV